MPHKDPIKNKEYSKEYYLNNREYFKQYLLDNKEKISEQKKEYYLDNKEKISERNKEWYSNNKEKIRIKAKKRRYVDIEYRLTLSLRGRLNQALNGKSKSKRTLELLGCTVKYLIEHLEKQFKPGMTWENRHLFHIDHIRPCASFDLTNPKQQSECFNYTNLQPLWAIDNMVKGAKW